MTWFVLVHGAWSDAAAWALVAASLAAAGHQVVAPDLPGHGADMTPPVSLQAYADTVTGAASALGSPAILVGHSMAGTVISTAGEQHPELVQRLVYVAALLLPSGQSLFGFTQSSAAFSSSLLGPSLRPEDGVLDVDRSRAREVFMADAPDDAAAAALARLRAEPLDPLTEPVTVTGGWWGTLTRAYIRTSADKTVPPAAQDEMVAGVGGVAAEATLECSHMAMLADPDGLAAAIVRLSA